MTSAVYELENFSSQLKVSELYSFGLSAQLIGRALVVVLSSVRYVEKGPGALTSGSTQLSRRRGRVHRLRCNQTDRRQHSKEF